MARPKKTATAKEPVTVRFKELSKGRKSIYLDIYRNGVRSYEFLKLYLEPERTPAERAANSTANRVKLDAANATKAERVREIINGEAGIKDSQRAKRLPLLEYMDIRRELASNHAEATGRKRKSSAGSITLTMQHLARYISQKYHHKVITLADVDKDFCAGFLEYLKTADVYNHPGHKLAPYTQYTYQIQLSATLNKAVREDLIVRNPMAGVDPAQKISQPHPERPYLTAEEVQTLIDTPCRLPEVKAAFLFACMCALRISDVRALTWGKVHTGGDAWQVETRMQKTQRLLYLPISEDARRIMPDRGDKGPEDAVFTLPKSDSQVNNVVKSWAKKAGITKDVTFHCARHTCATLMVWRGADLYTVKEMLGHSDIATTQIYAKIVDQKKRDAARLMDGLFNLDK